MTDISTELDQARDTCQQAVTALLNGDRDTAGDILVEGDCTLLAFVCADLVAHVHSRWAGATDIDSLEAWRELMLDIEEWRT